MGSRQRGYVPMKGGINLRLKVILSLINGHEEFVKCKGQQGYKV